MKVVVGIGNPARGDDGVGPHLVEHLAALGLPGVELVPVAEPLALIEILDRYDEIVVVDALPPQGRPGRVSVWPADSLTARRVPRNLGSHGLGVLDAVELSRALGAVPRRVTVVGVEAETFEAGAPVSRSVLDHLDEATVAVRAALGAPGLVTDI